MEPVLTKEIKVMCTRAKYLLSRMQIIPSKTSIVFDIDDTLISSTTREIIKPVYNLYKYALKIGVAVFIVTARVSTDSNIKYTTSELARFGIRYHTLFMRQNTNVDPALFKYKSRERIALEGNIIVMSVGDMDWDISGGFNGIGIKIPAL